MDSIDASGYKGKVFIAIDAAFSEFCKYDLHFKNTDSDKST